MPESTATEAATATEQTETTEQTNQEIDAGTDAEHWKAKAREWEKRAKENKDAASKLQELEDAKKTETEKLTDRAAKAETRASELESELLRLRVAISKQVPPDLVDRLRGETEEELAADADKLLKLVTPETDGRTAPAPRPDLSQGGSGNGAALNSDPLLNDLKSKLGIP